MNYYSFIENITGHRLIESNEKWMVKINNKELVNIRERYHENTVNKFITYLSKIQNSRSKVNSENYSDCLSLPKAYDYPTSLTYEHCPLMHGILHRDAVIFGGDGSDAFNINEQINDNAKRINRLKFYLLYSHKIILPDPMFYLCQYFSLETGPYIKKGKYQLAAFFNFLYEIRELVKSNVILFYPQYEHSGVGFHSKLFGNEHYENWLENRAEMLDIHAINPKFDSTTAPYLFSYAQEPITQLFFFCSRYKASIYFDSPRHEILVKEYLKYAASSYNTNSFKDCVFLPTMNAEFCQA